MKFRTEVEILPSSILIEPSDAVFGIGSCFATEMAQRMSDGQIQTLNNPFGTLFNPFSVNQCLQDVAMQKTYKEQDLVLYQEEYLSLHHHSQFSSRDLSSVLSRINAKIQESHAFLSRAKWVIITYGTAFAYEFLPQKLMVANCHKIPQKFFKKRMLTPQELRMMMSETVATLNQICPPETQILFTLSPVRHTKDGFVENQLSKSQLLCAMHEVVSSSPNSHYLPVYELMMDDLRDYRFYKEDLVHPSPQAVEYIWEKFRNAYFSKEAKTFVEENHKIKKALEHRPKDRQSPQYQAFLAQIQKKIQRQQQKVSHRIFSHNE